MPLSWNEIKQRALAFGNEWKDETREAAERQSFWNDFFKIFDIKRRTVASFEEPVKKLSGNWGAIDIFWPGKVLGEHKSAGQDLDKAHAQGMAYIRGLQDTGREKEVPRYLIVSDFQRIALHDLEPEEGADSSFVFPVTDLHKHIKLFGFIAGYKQHRLDPEDPANIEAAELMAEFHDALLDGGYSGHDLRVFLVRTLFCLFADDTGIFPPDAFKLYLRDRTAADGSDLGPKLARIFRVLNTPEDKRQANLDDDLRPFPYVNGDLFAEHLDFADFNTTMRTALLKAADFRWERISPAVFGSLFQGVMDKRERRQIGAHYTSEANILKLVRSLFLDDLRAEFDRLRALKIGKADKLRDLQKRLASLRFLDPACGCGNFLVITYRELRRLELDILKELHLKQHFAAEKHAQSEFTLDEVNKLSLIDVDQMFGIEIEEFPARIAEVALWLADHQANLELSQAFSQFYLRIPLRKSPHIHVANALKQDWKEVLPPDQCSYVLGNPPFVGAMLMSVEQRAGMLTAAGEVKCMGVLDLVCAWYFKAGRYIQGTRIAVGFVSTNSITQGEQAGILWTELFNRFGIKLHFAHRTFTWESEAKGKAHVHVVIVGFAAFDGSDKRIYDYDVDSENPTVTVVRNISPYLFEGPDVCISNRRTPICDVPRMVWGSQPRDGGNFLMTTSEKNELLMVEPNAARWVRPFTGAEEFLNGIERWCLWLVDISPNELNRLPAVKKRVEGVRDMRLASIAEATRKKATAPTLFAQIAQPDSDYLLVPLVSSERRPYIPIGFLSKTTIASNLCCIVPDASSLSDLNFQPFDFPYRRFLAGGFVRQRAVFEWAGAVIFAQVAAGWRSASFQEAVCAVSGGSERRSHVIEPLEVVAHAHEGPLQLHFGKSAQQELPEAHRGFDDAEDRFDGLLALRVERLAGPGFHPVRHDL